MMTSKNEQSDVEILHLVEVSNCIRLLISVTNEHARRDAIAKFII